MICDGFGKRKTRVRCVVSREYGLGIHSVHAYAVPAKTPSSRPTRRHVDTGDLEVRPFVCVQSCFLSCHYRFLADHLCGMSA